MMDTVELRYHSQDGSEQQVALPLVTGSEDERGIDIGALRAKTGMITLDPGYMNTGACHSAITYIDGDRGILRYRGIPIEVLAEKAKFLEVAFLLIYGTLPTCSQLERFEHEIAHRTLLHMDMKYMFESFPKDAHPMAMLTSMMASLTAFYQDDEGVVNEAFDLNVARILGKVPSLISYGYKRSVGEPFMFPDNSLSYCENFLRMMFAIPSEPYHVDPDYAAVLNLLLICHADHEQNCSTSTVRIARSSRAGLFASVAAGVCALWGPLHGGANQEVIEMLQWINDSGGNVKKAIELAKKKDSGFRLMGFGHRVYKHFDPRAKIIKAAADKLLKKRRVSDPLLDIAKELEEAALQDPYFIERKLYPNVDFYSGIIYKTMGIPVKTFPAMFAMGRMPGWIAHAREQSLDTANRIGRPRQIYTGPKVAEYVPIERRESLSMAA
jgi:citrate synthase